MSKKSVSADNVNAAKKAADKGVAELPADLTHLRYEEALGELESLVEQMESGEMPLDDLLTHYRRGAQLLHACRDRLAAVEEQVKLLEEGELKVWRDHP